MNIELNKHELEELTACMMATESEFGPDAMDWILYRKLEKILDEWKDDES